MPKKAELILVAFIVVLALVLWGFFALNKQEGARVVARVNGEVVLDVPLSEDKVYPLNLADGAENVLTVSGGQVWMNEANCPDQICVQEGKIHYSHETITCLPHRLVVSIEGGEESEVDGMAR